MADRVEIRREPLELDNLDLNRSELPAFIERHLLEMAPYRAFMPGQRDKSAETGQRMTQYIEDWDKRWKEMAGGHNNCHSKL